MRSALRRGRGYTQFIWEVTLGRTGGGEGVNQEQGWQWTAGAGASERPQNAPQMVPKASKEVGLFIHQLPPFSGWGLFSTRRRLPGAPGSCGQRKPPSGAASCPTGRLQARPGAPGCGGPTACDTDHPCDPRIYKAWPASTAMTPEM